jgi:divalent metal cation (Fe/Co/Zn/Cd) transporter
VNAALAAVKLAAGILGHTYALVADAVESCADIVASLVVWGGLHIAARPADDDHPVRPRQGRGARRRRGGRHARRRRRRDRRRGRAMIRTPHRPPAAWTLLVLVGVMAVKWVLSRRVGALGEDLDSTAVRADAGHHLSDAVTSAAAFVGITAALVGSRAAGTSAWAAADDWAALLAAGVIAYNGVTLLRPALNDLMDRMPGDAVLGPVERAARGVPGVLDVEKLVVRKAGMSYFVDIHVQADGAASLEDAHAIGGHVKHAIRAALPTVRGVLVHMEPFERTTMRDAGSGMREAGAVGTSGHGVRGA